MGEFAQYTVPTKSCTYVALTAEMTSETQSLNKTMI